jgi:hypothetical protein
MNTTYRTVNLFRREDGSYQTLGETPYEEDLESCLRLAHKSAYGTRLDRCMEELWKPLLIERRIALAMVEEKEKVLNDQGEYGIQTRPVGFRFLCFVTDKFDRTARRLMQEETLEPPLSAYLLEQHRTPHSPILTRQQIAHANALEELNAFSFTVHDAGVLKSPKRLHGYGTATIAGFAEICRGYLCQSCLFDGYSTLGRIFTELAGLKTISRFERYYRANSHISEEDRCWVGHVHRDQLPHLFGTVVNTMTRYVHPVLDLNPSQKETLECALDGADDQALAWHFGVKEAAIRKRFSEMFNQLEKLKAANELPKELRHKKRIQRDDLLDYVRQHPEEYRPYKEISYLPD